MNRTSFFNSFSHMAIHSQNQEAEAQPICQGVRHIPLSRKTEVTKLVKEMLDKRIVTQSSSPWAAPIVLEGKKGRKLLFLCGLQKA